MVLLTCLPCVTWLVSGRAYSPSVAALPSRQLNALLGNQGAPSMSPQGTALSLLGSQESVTLEGQPQTAGLGDVWL